MTQTPRTNFRFPIPFENDMDSEKGVSEDCEISCKEDCLLSSDSNSESIRCNMCMDWFHTQCVGITDIDTVGAWVCGVCRLLPKTVNQMKLQIKTLLDTITQFIQSFNEFSANMENKYENINDRLTGLWGLQVVTKNSQSNEITD